jgi:hypothetical protein
MRLRTGDRVAALIKSAGIPGVYATALEQDGESARVARRSEECCLLRSTVTDWTPEELWHAYVNSPKRKPPFACTNRIYRSGQCGSIASPSLTSWFAFWLTCCGRPWRPAVVRPASAMSRGRYLRNSPRSLGQCGSAHTQWSGDTEACISQPTEHQRILLQRLGMRLRNGPRTNTNVVQTGHLPIDSKDFTHANCGSSASFLIEIRRRRKCAPSS